MGLIVMVVALAFAALYFGVSREQIRMRQAASLSLRTSRAANVPGD